MSNKNNAPDRFPTHLLTAELGEKLDYFINKTIRHPHLDVAFKQLMAALSDRTGTPIVVVAGPTGVGKTTMAGRMEASILKQYLAEMKADPDFMPIYISNAIAPKLKNFNWNDFYLRLREKIDIVPSRHKRYVHRFLGDQPSMRNR